MVKSLAQLRVETIIDRINDLQNKCRVKLTTNSSCEYCIVAETEYTCGVMFAHRNMYEVEKFINHIYTWVLW